MKKILIFLTAIFLSIGVFGQDLNYVNFRMMQAAINAKASKALSNLASVAINTHLLPGTDGAVDLGSATKKWGDIFIDSAKVINWNNGDITATHSDNTLTFAGGDFVFPSTTSIGDVSADEISYVNGVTSAIQTQLNNKADTTGAIDIGDVTHLLTDTLELHTFNAGYNTAHDTMFFEAGSILGAYHTRGRDTTVLTHVVSQISDNDSLTFHILYANTINDANPVHVTDTIVLNDNSTVETITFECDTIPPDKWVYAKAIATPDGKNPIFFASTMVGKKVKGTSVDPLGMIANMTSDFLTIYNAFPTKPSVAVTQAMANLVYSLDTCDYWDGEGDAVWDRSKLLYMFAVHDSASAFINWPAPGTYDLTNPGSTDANFIVNQGFNAGGDDYFSTGWVPNLDSTQNIAPVGVNNLTIASWQLSNIDSDVTAGVIDNAGASIAITPKSSSLLRARINSGALFSLGTVNDPTGFTMATRTADQAGEGYLNGVSTGTDTDASLALPQHNYPLFVLARNNAGTADFFTTGIVSIILIMDKINHDDEAAAIYTIFDAYMTAIGN